MYQVNAATTPGSITVAILLEELALPYRMYSERHGVVRGGMPRPPVDPEQRLPTLHDPESGLVLAESSAILMHLAERHNQFIPTQPLERGQVFEQLFFESEQLGPTFAESAHFHMRGSPDLIMASVYFRFEAKRYLQRLEQTLAQRRYAAGDEYTIADMAHFGWLWWRAHARISLTDTPYVKSWFDDMLRRPAVRRAVARTELLTGMLP